MNTISSIVTFLMVFLIQNTQNRDSLALQLKLDELIEATNSRRDVIGVEEKSEPELNQSCMLSGNTPKRGDRVELGRAAKKRNVR